MISLVMLVLPRSVAKKSKFRTRHYDTVRILRNLVIISELSFAVRTYLQICLSSFAKLHFLHEVFFYRELIYLTAPAFQHGLVSCWNTKTGRFTDVRDYPWHGEVAIWCTFKEL